MARDNGFFQSSFWDDWNNRFFNPQGYKEDFPYIPWDPPEGGKEDFPYRTFDSDSAPGKRDFLAPEVDPGYTPEIPGGGTPGGWEDSYPGFTPDPGPPLGYPGETTIGVSPESLYTPTRPRERYTKFNPLKKPKQGIQELMR